MHVEMGTHLRCMSASSEIIPAAKFQNSVLQVNEMTGCQLQAGLGLGTNVPDELREDRNTSRLEASTLSNIELNLTMQCTQTV